MDIKKYNELMESNLQFDKIASECAKWLPESLYRYRRFGEYWEKEIKKGEIYLPEAIKLNDPMDCLISLDLKKIKQNSNFFTQLKYRCKVTHENFLQIAESDEEKLDDAFEQLRDDVKIACFSEDYNSNLMWSHYADMHQGFCIEYDTNNFKDMIKSKLFPVLYSEKKLDITKDLNECKNSAILKGFVYKNIEWSYEKEWRIVAFKNDRNAIYDKKSIKSIYLGAKCPEDKRIEILEWGRNNGKRIVQMKIRIDTYELSEEELVN